MGDGSLTTDQYAGWDASCKRALRYSTETAKFRNEPPRTYGEELNDDGTTSTKEEKTRRYGPRHAQAAKLCWLNRDYLQGTAWRTLISGDDPQMNAERARTITANGDVAVITPYWLNGAGIKAS